MQRSDWLLVLGRNGLVEGVEGGAPERWVGRPLEECTGISDAARGSGRALLRELAESGSSTLVRRVRVPPDSTEGPAYTLLSLEAILLRPMEVPLVPLIEDALEPLFDQAETDGILLNIDVADDVPERVAVDTEKIRWVVTALVGNALRYVRGVSAAVPGGHVTVRLRSKSRRIAAITVQDDGPGIPASVERSLLAPDPATGHTTGVTLRLVQDIVVAHGGGIVIRSGIHPHARGTAITLWIPVRR